MEQEEKVIKGVKGKQMTVADLIAALQGIDENALVWHEGCDCWGEADRVIFDGSVLITRVGGDTE